MARYLDVYLNRSLTGTLVQDETGDMFFDYAQSWLTDSLAMPLSHSLPLRVERYTQRDCKPFFGGILPEGGKRETIAKNLGISAKNDFAMLEQIGGECAGAVTFVVSGDPLPDGNDRYHPLTDNELVQILRELPRRPLLAGDRDIRLSLAGAQDKIAVRIADGQIYLPLAGAPSTHILKPAIAQFEGTAFNERLCMTLARVIGLTTAPVEMGAVRGIEYVLVERYDRVLTDSDVPIRLHQEDFCQALGIASLNKYQNEGGPSLQQCFELVRAVSSLPIVDLSSLLDCVIFNYLIGNNDAHGKNFSLIYQPSLTGIMTRLAPFYDLLSTSMYPELSEKMAMKIGGEYLSDRVYSRHFEKLAEEAGLGKPLVKRRVAKLAETIIATLPQVVTDHATDGQIAELITLRCQRAIERV